MCTLEWKEWSKPAACVRKNEFKHARGFMNRYFDHNATTPMNDAAKRAWLEAAERHWHNPSSLYREAGFAKQRLEEARERLAAMLGCEDAERVVFTSGATESNNALMASLSHSSPPDAVVAISAVEHPSVREAADHWFRGRVVEIPMDESGIVRLEEVSRITKERRPALISVMGANNESGALQPWAEIAEICRATGVPFHCDAAQWVGKLPAADCAAGAHYLTGSAHKFGGPKGCGFLVLSREDERLVFLRGGPQENDRRAGTENYPAIEAMVRGLEDVSPCIGSAAAQQRSLRDEFERAMQAAFPGLRIISGGTARLWNTSMFVMPRHENLKWLTRLTRRGFAISTGSACSSGKEGSSVVVRALGASDADLRRVLRVSGGWEHTAEDWRALTEAFAEAGRELDAGGKGQAPHP